jgi:hypothetical protein
MVRRFAPLLFALVACRQPAASGAVDAAMPEAASADVAPIHEAAAAAPIDLDAPSWFACASDAECTIIMVGTSCAWLAVRADKANEYATIDGQRHAAEGAGRGCMHISPRPKAVCRESKCAAVESPVR